MLRAANNCCVRCRVQNRTLIFLSTGEVSHILYLHCAHLWESQKLDPAAPLMALCPTCHYFYDKPRSSDTVEGAEDWEFIGFVAQEFIEQNAKWLAEHGEVHE